MAEAGTFPSPALRAALIAYRVIWFFGLPLALIYLWRRGRRDPLYFQHLGERFGRQPAPIKGAVWVHAASLGEMRSAVPLIHALLARGQKVLVTTLTPTGRREAERVLASAIAAKNVQVVWTPFDTRRAYRRFFGAFSPEYGLVMEAELWPQMIMSARRAAVPLFACNAQYPSRSFARDQARLKIRSELLAGYAGALVKSEVQAKRLIAAGQHNIAVTGELRFDQPIPAAHLRAGAAARQWLAPDGRSVIAIASVVEGEDATYLNFIIALRALHASKGTPAPLFIYIPRKPERFDTVAGLIAEAGLNAARRADVFDVALGLVRKPGVIDVLLGDSLGEMYFYLAMADRVIVGGGFTPKGTHNIIEALALRKPVVTGPEVWQIETPMVEAMAASVALRVETPAQLLAAFTDPHLPDAKAIEAFFAANAGSTKRTLDAIPALLAAATSH